MARQQDTNSGGWEPRVGTIAMLLATGYLASCSGGGPTTGGVDGSGMLTRTGTMRSSAFALGLTAADLLQTSDRLGFSILQPIRVDSGTAELDVPVAQDATGAVLFARQEADLAPDGREIDVELTYGWDVGRARLQAAAMLRLEPDHDASAEPELLLGFAWHLPF